MTLVDSHCHLDHADFEDDRDQVIQRALDAGIERMLAIGTGDGPPDLEAGLRLAVRYEPILATAGIHPNDADRADDKTFDHLAELVQHPKLVAVGEIGLDFHYNVPRDIQESVFRRQLSIAAAAAKPIVIHTRDAFDETLQILQAEWAPTGLHCVMHCFTGNARQAQDCLALGFHLAFGGMVTFGNAHQIREALAVTPDDRLLVETDAPYLAPKPHRGKRNEPAFVAYTAQAIAALRGREVASLAAQITANFDRICAPKGVSSSC